LVVLAAIIIGAGIWIWEEKLEDHFIPKRWGVVEEGKIYRSGQLSSTLIRKMLRKHNIAVIVDLTFEVPGDRDQEAERQAAVELGIEVYRYPLRGDGTGDIGNYAKAIATIVDAKNKGKCVLVHCAAGAQRTGGVIACYRVLVEKREPSFAYAEMKRYDWREKHDQVLLTYMKQNMAQLAELLKQMGVIEDVPQPLPTIPSRNTAR
jgi:protein tyrosine/serine phosphatase